MHTEIEVKFLDIDVAELRQRLKQHGAQLVQPERTLRRRNFDFSQTRHDAWVRVRDEANKITITYKKTQDTTVHGTHEINLEVDNFEAACEFMNAIGLKEKSEKETRRESWLLDEVQIEIDTWPWIPSFVELEGNSVDDLRHVAQKLDFSWESHLAGDVTGVYRLHYKFDVHDLYNKPIVFGPTPSWLKPRNADAAEATR